MLSSSLQREEASPSTRAIPVIIIIIYYYSLSNCAVTNFGVLMLETQLKAADQQTEQVLTLFIITRIHALHSSRLKICTIQI